MVDGGVLLDCSIVLEFGWNRFTNVQGAGDEAGLTGV